MDHTLRGPKMEKVRSVRLKTLAVPCLGIVRLYY